MQGFVEQQEVKGGDESKAINFNLGGFEDRDFDVLESGFCPYVMNDTLAH